MSTCFTVQGSFSQMNAKMCFRSLFTEYPESTIWWERRRGTPTNRKPTTHRRRVNGYCIHSSAVHGWAPPSTLQRCSTVEVSPTDSRRGRCLLGKKFDILTSPPHGEYCFVTFHIFKSFIKQFQAQISVLEESTCKKELVCVCVCFDSSAYKHLHPKLEVQSCF